MTQSKNTTVDLPENIQDFVDQGKVTYRGYGISDLEHTKIKINGKEYKITSEKFRELGGIEKMKFAAPARKG